MYKQSVVKKIFIIGFYFVLSIGIGVIATIPLISLNIINDDANLIMTIALPIALIFLTYQIITLFNKIDVNEKSIVVTTLFRKKYEYSYSQYSIDPRLGGFSLYGAPFIEYLKIKFISNDTHRSKSFGFAGYKRKHIDEMIELLNEYYPVDSAEDL